MPVISLVYYNLLFCLLYNLNHFVLSAGHSVVNETSFSPFGIGGQADLNSNWSF